MGQDKKLKNFFENTTKDFLNESSFKVTQAQLNKLNKRAKEKYPEINVAFYYYDKKLQAKYTELVTNNEDKYFYQLWNSIIHNADNFDDVYYSV